MKTKNQPKKYYTILILAVLLIVAILIFLYKPFKRSSKPVVQTEPVGEYTIGVYEEKIAVFTQGDKLPIEIYDVYVSTLPIVDQKELLNGIKVKGSVELKRRIEDYTS